MKNYTIIPNEILESNQLSLCARFLYCILLRHCGQDDHCYPSQKTLGKEMGKSDRHVRDLLNELIKAGMVSKKRLGFNRANTYTIAKSLKTYRIQGSCHIGSTFPLHQGTTVPDKNTYLKGKGKSSRKGMERLRKIAESLRPSYSYKEPIIARSEGAANATTHT